MSKPSGRPQPDSTAVARMELKRVAVSEWVMDDEELRTSPMIRALGEEARILLEGAIGRRFADQVSVFQRDEPGDSLFFVVRGKARLFAHADGNSLELEAARRGDVFGESEVVDGGPGRFLSAVADGALEVVELPRQVVVDSGRSRPEVLQYLTEVRDRRRAELAVLADFIGRW